MIIFLDECINKKMVQALRILCPTHSFLIGGVDTAAGTTDLPLFEEVAGRGAELFVTNDVKQLFDLSRQHERAACRKWRLHWLGLPKVPAKGRLSLYAEMSHLVASLELIARHSVAQEEPQYYLLNQGRSDLRAHVVQTGPI